MFDRNKKGSIRINLIVTPLFKVEQLALDVVIFDKAVLVQMLLPGTANTFEEYVHDVFAPYILRQVSNTVFTL